jgi:hypothetical protein
MSTDNTRLSLGSGGDLISTDFLTGSSPATKVQRVKVQYGAEGTATDVALTTPMPVTDQGRIAVVATGTINSSATASLTCDYHGASSTTGYAKSLHILVHSAAATARATCAITQTDGGSALTAFELFDQATAAAAYPFVGLHLDGIQIDSVVVTATEAADLEVTIIAY